MTMNDVEMLREALNDLSKQVQVIELPIRDGNPPSIEKEKEDWSSY